MAEVTVKLWGSLRSLAGGEETVRVEAGTLKQALDAIAAAHPALQPQIARGVSFSVDGTVYRDSWLVRIEPGQEVVMMPRMVGG